MADVTTNTAETPGSQAQDALDAMHKRKKTAGEVVFDRVVYTGIGFGVNEASSLWITDQFVYGKKNLFENIPGLRNFGKWFTKDGYDKIRAGMADHFKIKDGVDHAGNLIPSRAKAGNLLLMITLLSGGTLLILPMKWLEDHKIPLVKKTNHLIDRLRGTKMTGEELAARDDEVEQAIACSPRQSWPSMLLGRVIACTASVSTGTFLVGPENNNKLMKWSEKTLTGSLQPSAQRNAAHRYARLFSVETYSCAISSIVLELVSKLSAKHRPRPHDPELCYAAAAALPAGGEDGQTATDNSGGVGKYSGTILAQRAQPVQMAAQV